MPFFKNEEQKGETVPVWELVLVRRRCKLRYKARVKEAKCSGNITYSCMKMEKMRPVETVPGIGGGG
jgi:hypothetical protein